MKAKLWMISLLFGAFAFTSCDNDDDNFVPESAVLNAFKQKYPEARSTSWENRAGYMKAEFNNNNYETEAWFDLQGNWVMTETDIPYNALPQAVKTTFEAGQYAQWKVDDVDKIERPDAGTVYIIEVEKGETDIDLHYAEDGTFIKEVVDSDNEHLPSVTPDAIKTFIANRYPGATILEIDTEARGIEVDILHETIHKDVWFNSDNQWMYTEWEIRSDQVPDIVMNALRSSQYASYQIDDIDVIEKPDGLFYEFELEQGDKEMTVTFSEDGTLTTPAY